MNRVVVGLIVHADATTTSSSLANAEISTDFIVKYSTILDQVLIDTDYDVLIVEDRHESPCIKERYFHHAQNKRLHFLKKSETPSRHPLLTLFNEAQARNFSHLIVVETLSDVLDLPRLRIVAEKNTLNLIVGAREKGELEKKPAKRSLADFWMKYQASAGILDAHSGFRIYPLDRLVGLKLHFPSEWAELEILMKLIWRGTRVQYVPVRSKKLVVAPARRGSLFKKSLLDVSVNTALIAVALFRDQSSPLKSAAAFGVGIFVGCTPFLGFHALILAAIAYLFRLNFVYLWVGSNISMPPMTPLILLAAHYLGKIGAGLLHRSEMNEASSFVMGLFIVGFILGLVGFALVYFFKKRNQRKELSTSEN